MEDRQIVDLFWARSEVAITEAQKEYYTYCLAIAKRLLGDERDAEEVVNDAFLAAWHSIPPQRPEVLSAYLGKLTRRIAIDRIRQRTAKKRGFSETELALEELESSVSLPRFLKVTGCCFWQDTGICVPFPNLLPRPEAGKEPSKHVCSVCVKN